MTMKYLDKINNTTKDAINLEDQLMGLQGQNGKTQSDLKKAYSELALTPYHFASVYICIH